MLSLLSVLLLVGAVRCQSICSQNGIYYQTKSSDNSDSEIQCTMTGDLYNDDLGEDMRKAMLYYNDRTVRRVLLNSEAITHFEANQFNKSVEVIEIRNCTNLGYISPKTFNNSERLTTLAITGPNEVNLKNARLQRDFFKAVNNATRLTFLAVNVSHMDEVPEDGFNSRSLSFIALSSGNKIKRIAPNAFANIEKHGPIRRLHIQIANQMISSIGSMAFAVKQDTASSSLNWMISKQLTIDLHSNNLTSESFDSPFNQGGYWPVDINLDDNHFTYLKQDIFEPLVMNQGVTEEQFQWEAIRRISVFKNPIDCEDCKNQWIVSYTNATTANRIIVGDCKDKRSLRELTEDSFKHCDERDKKSRS